jgi:hypothetical protein
VDFDVVQGEEMNKTHTRTIASLWLCGIVMTISAHAAGPVDSCFRNPPSGCFVNNSVELAQDQVVAIGSKLGAGIKRISNNFLTVQGNAIQVNILEGKSEPDAIALCKAISGMKSNSAFCLRNGNRVVEYVGEDAALAIKTSYELGFIAKPKQIRYRVTAEVATIDKADYMAFNALFNLFLTAGTREAGRAAPPQIAALSKRFQFGNSITLREPGNPPCAIYSFNPRLQEKSHSNNLDSITYTFDGLADAFGVPYVTLTADIRVDDKGFTSTSRRSDKSLLSATTWWPVDDPQIKLLAGQIVSKAQTQEAKIQAILTWLAPGTNIKFGGPVTGSRWGVKEVLKQKYGQCWDFADCFITLCRAAGIPCRQVAGWLYGTSGHVWAEVLIDGKGWQQVDATGGGRLRCGIYHIPYFITEDGEMPVLYVSMPKIDILETK